MKSNIQQLFAGCIFLFFVSCAENKSTQEKEFDYLKYKNDGAAITTSAQGTLIQHLNSAIDEGGTEHAVQFCNLKAMEVTDSISRYYDCVLSRISDRNRNPENSITIESDKNIWNHYKSGMKSKSGGDTVINNQGRIVYYRPILIGMPTCLKCHGKPAIDIDANTLVSIDSLYPKDLAKNYEKGDLRGLWKIEFNTPIQ